MILLSFLDITQDELKRLVLSGLKSFIGQSSEEVRAYWKAFGIPEALLSEGVWSDSRERYLVAMYEDAGRPEFEATFKRGKCVSQSISIKADDLPECIEALRRMRFSYSAKLKRWSKPGESYVWRIDELAGNNYSLSARRFLKSDTK